MHLSVVAQLTARNPQHHPFMGTVAICRWCPWRPFSSHSCEQLHLLFISWVSPGLHFLSCCNAIARVEKLCLAQPEPQGDSAPSRWGWGRALFWHGPLSEGILGKRQILNLTVGFRKTEKNPSSVTLYMHGERPGEHIFQVVWHSLPKVLAPEHI
jgi:hypothetical protein